MTMLVVAGLSLNNLKPRVWDSFSPYYLSTLRAVMVSYADFHKKPASRKSAMEKGLHDYLGVPEGVAVYLDNGAFCFLNSPVGMPVAEYEEFVERARPDWHPIPQDFIPTPGMSVAEQRKRYLMTMKANRAYQHDGYVPVIHVGPFLDKYVKVVLSSAKLAGKGHLALGGIVPNLLRAPKAIPYQSVLDSLHSVRSAFPNANIHIFGVGGTATLHLAGLLRMDSVDSSGWRNRAARGLVQLQGSGDRMVADLGSWRGRKPSEEEWGRLTQCQCPACLKYGLNGLKARAIDGFCNRATHNLWTLLEEARLIDKHLKAGTYRDWYEQHLDNSTYRPLITKLLERLDNQPVT